MKAISVPSAGAKWEIVDVPIPEPEEGQLLVKVIYAGLNPVERFQAEMGILIDSWPLTPGTDAAGIVVKAGKNAISPLGKPFKEGDRVFGCTRLGTAKYQAFQEYNIMDAFLAVPVPDNVTLAGASTMGVASFTAFLGIVQSLKVPIPDPSNLPPTKDEFALVLGGGSSVGKLAIQILKLCGYKIISTGSPRSFDMMKKTGVDEVVDYKQPQDAIISEIVAKTGGKMYLIYDAVATNIPFSVPMFKAIKGDKTKKIFTGTDDWDPLPETDDFTATNVSLGPIGKPQATETNKPVSSSLPFLYAMLKQGKIVPNDYIEYEKSGVEALPEASAFQLDGKGGNKKVIVKIQDE